MLWARDLILLLLFISSWLCVYWILLIYNATCHIPNFHICMYLQVFILFSWSCLYLYKNHGLLITVTLQYILKGSKNGASFCSKLLILFFALSSSMANLVSVCQISEKDKKNFVDFKDLCVSNLVFIISEYVPIHLCLLIIFSNIFLTNIAYIPLNLMCHLCSETLKIIAFY